MPNSNGEGSTETGDHESPVSPEEVLGQRVEGNVGARALSVVVRTGELGPGGGKATTGDEGSGHSGAESRSGNGVGATNGLNEEKNKDGPNTAAIAAGVVVGVVGFCSLVGAGFFLWRFRKRTNVRPQYSNNAGATEHFGKPMSQDSMSDSRFDGDFMAQRRQSNGSIDDDQDFSRRILQVTNPDNRR